MVPKLELCFTLRAYVSIENSHVLTNIQGGPTRIILPISKGYFKGSGIDAEIVPGGSDWLLMDPSTAVAHLDVRTQARSSQGYSFYAHYSGRLKMTDAANKILSRAPDASPTEFGDQEWFISPVMETNDPTFKWMEDSQWIGQGRFVVEGADTAVEYEIYKVIN